MYRHLLVPVDDTDLSVEVIGNAAALARLLGACLTFFHVVDAAASPRRDAEVLRITARDEYECAHSGKAREQLNKAEAARAGSPSQRVTDARTFR